MRLLSAVLALLPLLVAPAAYAEDYKASVAFNGCNTEQQAALRQGMVDTYRNLGKVLEALDNPEMVNGYLAAWFGAGKRATIRRTYESILTRLNDPGTLVLACEERNCEHNLMGYTDLGSLSVCPEFFNSKANEGYDSRFGTLIHEFSHMVADTDDHAYGTGDARRLALEHPAQATDNADNYQYFAEAVVGNNTPHGTTAWRQQDSCQWALDGECDHPGIGTGACQTGTDTTDCHEAPRQSASNVKSPSFGTANPKDTCASALNGRCDEPGRDGSDDCALGTDYTDCLTGRTGKSARQ